MSFEFEIEVDNMIFIIDYNMRFPYNSIHYIGLKERSYSFSIKEIEDGIFDGADTVPQENQYDVHKHLISFKKAISRFRSNELFL